MKLSENTMTVLRNFSTIQPNIIFHENNVVKTMSEAKNIVSVAKLDQNFEKECGIYNLDVFLQVLSLVDSPELTFGDEFVKVSDGSGLSSVKYYYSEPSILTAPPRDIPMPEEQVRFELDRNTLNRIRKAASALGHEKMTITAGSNGLKITVVDNTDYTSNAFEIIVPGSYDEPDGNFSFVMNIANLKLVDADYHVKISSALISEFKVKGDMDITYYIALEKSSKYGA